MSVQTPGFTKIFTKYFRKENIMTTSELFKNLSLRFSKLQAETNCLMNEAITVALDLRNKSE
jgi:hypothetical protein